MRPTLFLLHALGSSAREWDSVIRQLDDRFDCVALDLPGFGDRTDDPRTDVAQMLDWLSDEVRARAPDAWMIVGHSMGGKLATLLTARAEAGAIGLSALAGTVLVAGSPPTPEPMAENRRAEMVGWFADGPPTEDQARRFVRANIAGDLPPLLFDAAVADVQRSGRHAWLAWLERGSREDWSDRVGRLNTPALVVAGADDGDLGEEAQRRLNAPLYVRAMVEVVADAAHLIPYEQSRALAALIDAHWAHARGRVLPPAFARALASDRASARTRATLLARLDDPVEDDPSALSERQLAVLHALVERVLPDTGLDLARRMDVGLASGPGDGWRFAELPPDPEAWALGLDTLDTVAHGFPELSPDRQDVWLDRMAAGKVGVDGAVGRLSATQMRLWFEDVRAETARTWMAHPAAMARIGYDGVLTGGDGDRIQGFTRTRADDPEPWEPALAGGAA